MMFLTASKKGLAERMNITDTALAFELISSKKPGATLADAPPVIIKITETPLSFAESNDLDKNPTMPSTPNWLSREDGLAFLDKNSVLWIETGAGKQTVLVMPNGTAEIKDGFVSHEKPLHESALQEQAALWLRTGQTGVSSKTMCHALTGLPENMDPSDYSVPWDPSDFKRCSDFLKAVPLALPHLDKMKDVSPVWGQLVNIWPVLEDELEKQINSEPSTLYDKIRAITTPPPRPKR